MPLALVIHELATNALKYGALRDNIAGRLETSWDVVGNRLCFRWACCLESERIAPPTRQGFGLRMIRQAIERKLFGELRMDWEPDGLKLRLSVPLEKQQGTAEQVGRFSESAARHCT
jgi:two-component sensor histidine kinase